MSREWIPTRFEVKSIAGDIHLDLEDFETHIRVFLHAGLQAKESSQGYAWKPFEIMRSRNQCERAMRTLPSSTQATVEIDPLVHAIALLAHCRAYNLRNLISITFDAPWFVKRNVGIESVTFPRLYLSMFATLSLPLWMKCVLTLIAHPFIRGAVDF